jgi:hypothetical protein
MPKKTKLVEPDEERDDEEEEEDEFEDDPENEYAPGMKPGELGERDLSRVLSKYDWASGQYYIDLYRDRPFEFRNKDVHGFVDRISRPIDIAWIEKFHGGKTYHILIRGPHKGRENVIIGRVNSIVVAGDPKIGGREAREAAEHEELGEKTAPDGIPAAGYEPTVAARLADATIEESRDLRRHLLKGGGRSSDLSAILGQQAKTLELAQQRADAESSRQNAMILELLRSRDRMPDAGAGYREIVEQMRRDMDSARTEHGRELRAMAERQERDLREMEQRAREQIDRMRDDASKERDRLRDESDRREQRLRDEWSTREQSIRDMFEARIASQRENAEARERSLFDQLTEAREKARDLEGRLGSMTGERDGARLEAVRLESVLSTKQDPKPPLEALREVMALGSEVATLTGQAPAAETAVDQAVKVLQSEPAQRLAAGLQGFLTNLSGKQSPAPPAAGLQQWQSMVQGGQPGLPPPPQMEQQQPTGRVVRRRRRTDTPEKEMEAPTINPEEQPPQEPTQPEQTQEGGVDAKVVFQLIEDSAAEGKPAEQFIKELAAMVGGMGELQGLALLDPEIVLQGLEENSGEALTFQTKSYLRSVIPVLREMLQAQSTA